MSQIIYLFARIFPLSFYNLIRLQLNLSWREFFPIESDSNQIEFIFHFIVLLFLFFSRLCVRIIYTPCIDRHYFAYLILCA